MEEENVFTPISSDVLNEYVTEEQEKRNIEAAEGVKEVINQTLADFGVQARVKDYIVGPSITRFNLELACNCSVRTVSNVIADIQIRLGGVPVRYDSTSIGSYAPSLEVENPVCKTVSFKELYDALPDEKKHPLAIPLGQKVNGDAVWIDLPNAPHILISGTTGSGMSMLEQSIITTLMMRNSPESLKFVLFDLNRIKLNRFKDEPHLLYPIVRDANTAKHILNALCEEMESRYTSFCDTDCCNIDEYNEGAEEYGAPKLPHIVVVFDEYADLADQDKSIYNSVISLAQKARAAGIHLIITTERPATNVLTGVLKANLPTRIALMMSSVVDSMTVIGEGGAEKLVGKGDMLVQSPLVSKLGLVRLQGCFIHRTEISKVVSLLKEKYSLVDLKMIQDKRESLIIPKLKKISADETLEDETRYQAVKVWVMTQEYMSISRIQRECGLGFNRAGRFFLRLQEEGIVDKECRKHGCLVLKHNEDK